MEDFKICQHDEFCGGCIYQGVPYEQQLKAKNSEVLSLLEKKDIKVEKIDYIEGCPCLLYTSRCV